MTQHATPVSSDERVFALDVIRGVALLGIFIMNMPGFVASFYSGMVGFHPWPHWWDEAIEMFRNVMLGGKFNSMFSFLFGIGFTIQLARIMERHRADGDMIYLRRLLALMAFGVLHACLLWTGDVLHIYALLGILLLVMRNASDRTIIILIVLCIIGPPLTGVTRLVLGIPDATLASHEFQRWQTSNDAAYGHGTFFDAAREHTLEMLFLYTAPGSGGYVFNFYLQMTTTLLIGVLAGRHRWIQNAVQLMPILVRWQWSMLVLGLATGVVYAYGETEQVMLGNSLWIIGTQFAYVLCRLGLVAFYVIALLRLTLRQGWRMPLTPIALVGRMPLTNYLLQTIMATFIFYGWGLGYWNRGGPAAWFALAVALYVVVQIPLSALWLKLFPYGPMEYLWRVLTYGPQSMTRTATPAAIAATEPPEIPADEPPVAAPAGPESQSRDTSTSSY